MTTVEAFTFTPEQFATLINSILGVIAAVVGATVWITYKIRGVEKDIEYVLKNPYIKAFRDLEEKHAKESAERFHGKTLNTWEAEKKVSEGEDTSNK